MISYEKFTLENGLKVIVHQDLTTPFVAFNILYNVGARDESPERTGFAHLFEHLMFGGSKNVPNFDEPLEYAGGTNNAFTNNDITNYYDILPKENIETAFWLESDRMLSLAFTDHSLEVQRKVVIEEFKQSYLNQPYGDMSLLMRPLAFKEHPYRWSTIGKNIAHIEEATMEEVKDFFYSHYAPNNAVLCLAGNIDLEEAKRLSEKWFAPIEPREIKERQLPKEPKQTEYRLKEVERDVPADAIQMCFKMCDRLSPDYYASDLLSDVLSNGKSSRLYQNLVVKKNLFSSIDAFIYGSFDPGLFVFKGKLMPETSMQEAEQVIWDEIQNLLENGLKNKELEKVKNKIESHITMSNIDLLNRAINLCMFELLGHIEWVNTEQEAYQKVSETDFMRNAQQILRRENCSVLHYYSKSNKA